MDETAYGTLIAEVRTANGALPVEGANVIVYNAEGNGEVLYNTFTGIDGRTPAMKLQTRPKELSENPGDDAPYRVYDVRTLLNGFYEVSNTSVPIFDGIVSIQPINMRPLPYGVTSGSVYFNELSFENLNGTENSDEGDDAVE